MLLLFVPAAPVHAKAAAAGSTYVVGVDMATPAGHNIAALDYFPRGDATYPLAVTSGDVLDFKWNTGQPDQLHTATFLKSTETVPAFYAANPGFTPDADDGAGALNFAFPAPTFPPARTGAPGACGDAVSPCPYDGTAELSSGATPTAFGGDFFVKVTAGPGTYTYACLIHPFMTGSVTVVASSPTTPTAAASEAAAQTAADVAEGLAAESSVGPATSVTNADGTKTWTAVAGTGSAHTEVLEMLPANIPVRSGDKVMWKTTTVRDIHTVTFPYGEGSNSVDPFQPTVCEAAGSTDTPATGGPPNFGCSPGTAENPVNVAAVGPTTLTRHGYRLVATDGGVFTHGDATFLGGEGGSKLNKPVVGMASTPDGQGYWSVASDGGIFTHGNASFLGSEGGGPLNKPVVGMTSTPDGHGYGLVASDGGIFTHGDFPFLGSTGGLKLNAPVIGMDIAHGFGPPGYWLAGTDGGVFSFGTGARFFGSLGAMKLNKPIVGIAGTPDGGGYWMVASDGGIFTFGDAPFKGSLGSVKLNKPIVAMVPTPSGQGYWLVASDGGIFTFGDANFFGSEGGAPLNKPVVGMAAMPADVSTSGIIATPPAPFPATTAAYTFKGVGAFSFQCRIHDNMVGWVVSS
jgi:plastocyanin